MPRSLYRRAYVNVDFTADCTARYCKYTYVAGRFPGCVQRVLDIWKYFSRRRYMGIINEAAAIIQMEPRQSVAGYALILPLNNIENVINNRNTLGGTCEGIIYKVIY